MHWHGIALLRTLREETITGMITLQHLRKVYGKGEQEVLAVADAVRGVGVS